MLASSIYFPFDWLFSSTCIGFSLQLIDSVTGPSTDLANALWYAGTTPNQSHLLYHNNDIGWQFDTPYRWTLIHNPGNGYIRVIWYQVIWYAHAFRTPSKYTSIIHVYMHTHCANRLKRHVQYSLFSPAQTDSYLMMSVSIRRDWLRRRTIAGAFMSVKIIKN